ncbi:hypothetical protein UCDDA912_g09234 [Diaporthe ampelina]|uniref:Uncharacterized protein n=1 Tax=Diaporthe ampelina TaxID=1214573 RepID=A0A0G2H6K3_9PEZI|nr:hypothetical protein UCDDA912_g09234 [Diaporthe ampelina]
MGGDGSSVYDCNWELQVGDVKGAYSIRVALPHGKWRGYRGAKSREDNNTHGARGEDEDAEGEEDDSELAGRGDDNGEDGDKTKWQRKYRDLLEIVQQQKSELMSLMGFHEDEKDEF